MCFSQVAPMASDVADSPLRGDRARAAGVASMAYELSQTSCVDRHAIAAARATRVPRQDAIAVSAFYNNSETTTRQWNVDM